jgi:hypothetical protein
MTFLQGPMPFSRLLATGVAMLGLLQACDRQRSPPATAAVVPKTPAKETTPSPTLDACALITPADVDAILGAPGKPTGHAADDRFSSHCSYESVDASRGFNGFGVEIGTSKDILEARTSFEVKQQLYLNYTIYHYELLPDIGDAAFLAVSKIPEQFKAGEIAALVAHQQILATFRNVKSIDITTSYFGPEKSTEAMQALARKLIARF